MSTSGTRNLCDELTTAIRLKNTERLTELVRQGADLNMTLSEGLLPVVLAANSRDVDLCRLLVQLGARLDFVSDSALHETPLSIAIRVGLENAVATLIEIGADVNTISNLRGERLSSSDPFRLNPGSTALQSAIYRHNLPIVRRLVDAGADVNQRDRSGNSALHLACLDRRGNDEIVRYLLSVNRGFRAASRRTDIDARNSLSQTPLMFAASVSPSMTCLLLKANPPPILKTVDIHRETVLHYGVRSGSEETLLMLLNADCSVDGVCSGTAHHTTPLHLAAKLGNSNFCGILLDFGADPFAVNMDGDTVFHQAASCTNWTDPVDILQRFFEVGIDIEAKNSSGQTALIVAANSGNTTVASYLISVNARLDSHTSDKQSALSKSLMKGHLKLTQMLIVEGAADDEYLMNLRLHLIPQGVPELLNLLFLTNPRFARHHLDSYIQSSESELDLCSSQHVYLKHFVSAGILMRPRSLKDSCRLTIRTALVRCSNGTGIVRSLLALPLPRSLHSYLCYVNEMPGLFSTDEGCSDSE